MTPFNAIKSSSTHQNKKRPGLTVNTGIAAATPLSAVEKKPNHSTLEQRKENSSSIIDLTLSDGTLSLSLETRLLSSTNAHPPSSKNDTFLCYDRFPPTISTNVQYRNGIQLHQALSQSNSQDTWMNCVIPEDYYQEIRHIPSHPAFLHWESILWTQPHMSHCIATTACTSHNHHFPNHATRYWTSWAWLEMPHIVLPWEPR
jgi:hypothetical protein